MPKLNLQNLKALKGFGGEIRALRGPGFVWTRPVGDLVIEGEWEIEPTSTGVTIMQMPDFAAPVAQGGIYSIEVLE